MQRSVSLTRVFLAQHRGSWGASCDTAAVNSPFLEIPPARRLAANELAFAVADRYPISPGHTLVVPFRDVEQWWDATPAEQHAVMDLVAQVRHLLLDDEERGQWFPGVPRPDGFNVGFNSGVAAGQTVFHLHVHVIPRYAGDIEDPAGGLRHLIPGKGNYLEHLRARTAATSPAEEELATQLESGELIQRVLSLLDDGKRTATYKPALLMALIELAQERANGDDPLRLPLQDIAERVMESYWPHTRPYSPLGSVLRQATNPRSRILVALGELRTASSARVSTPLSRVARFYPEAYAAARSAVADTLAKQPIPRLQRPGVQPAGVDYPRFLYDDSEFRIEAAPRVREPAVTLRPGVATALARSAPLMRIAVQDVWTREVIHINRMKSDDEQLRAFLFGAERVSLRAVAQGLREAGATACFWCAQPLGSHVHVDHVIPWSHYASDDLANLVLVDAACNSDKRDRLVTGELVARWQDRDLATLRAVADDITWPLDVERTRTVAATAYRYLADGMVLWGGRRHLAVMTPGERGKALEGLGVGDIYR